MSKAILVIEMPENCWECCLNNRHFCDVSTDSIEEYMNTENRPSWCPLKPIPQKIGVDEAINMPRNGNIVDVIKSYNACIDEILGGTE